MPIDEEIVRTLVSELNNNLGPVATFYCAYKGRTVLSLFQGKKTHPYAIGQVIFHTELKSGVFARVILWTYYSTYSEDFAMADPKFLDKLTEAIKRGLHRFDRRRPSCIKSSKNQEG